MFKKFRIDYLLFGGTAGLIIGLLTVVIWVAYFYSAQQMVQNTSYYQQSLLNEYYNKVVLQTRAVEQISLNAIRNTNLLDNIYVKDDPYLAYTRQQEVKAFLALLTYATKDIESVHFYVKQAPEYEPQGPVRFIEHDSMKSEEWYTEDLDNTDFSWLGEHTIQTNRGEVEVISFARKAYSNTGEYRGLLLLNIDSSSIRSLMQSDNDANRILLDSGGRKMLSIGSLPFTDEEVNGYLTDLKNGSGYMHVEANSKTNGRNKQLMVWSKDYNNGWTLVEFTPWKTVTAGSVKIALVLLLVGVIVIVIALCSTLLFARQFVKPIRLLLKEMGQNFGSANKVNLPEDYSNEFGSMFAGYRKLIERIQSLYTSLEDQYRRQKEAEIKALQAMINPHFLYNTLDQLNWMAIVSGQEKISKILELMGKMFRIGLSNGESLITIREELIHITCYMEIQQIRLGEQFILQVNVANELMDMYIPKMTLQPFIENAIIHGFHGRQAGLIEVTVEAIYQNNMIVFQVKDNGNGLRDNWQQPSNRKTGGYGIRNVRERIHIFFGNNYGLELVPNEGSNGTIVFIRLPMLKQREER